MSQSINRIGIDLAKSVFQICATDASGAVVFNRTVKRAQLSELILHIPPCEVVMEACATSNYWARVFQGYGHQVKLIHPAFVRPYVKTNKNDAADAEALCEAASRPTMRFVQPKSVEQQDIQLLHRLRERLVGQRTALSNQTRGLLAEYGITAAQGLHQLRRQLPEIVEDADNGLSPLAREAFAVCYEELIDLSERIKTVKQQITSLCETNPRCQQLISVPGVGPMVATALVATMGDPSQFKNGREFAAFLGLVPRQYSTGGKTILKGISKRGDPHLRTLLIQGAQAVLRHLHKRDDRLSRWACQLKTRKSHSVVVVALANKLARICWAMAAKQTTYRATTV